MCTGMVRGLQQSTTIRPEPIERHQSIANCPGQPQKTVSSEETTFCACPVLDGKRLGA